jgi:hypothetical protein
MVLGGWSSADAERGERPGDDLSVVGQGGVPARLPTVRALTGLHPEGHAAAIGDARAIALLGIGVAQRRDPLRRLMHEHAYLDQVKGGSSAAGATGDSRGRNQLDEGKDSRTALVAPYAPSVPKRRFTSNLVKLCAALGLLVPLLVVADPFTEAASGRPTLLAPREADEPIEPLGEPYRFESCWRESPYNSDYYLEGTKLVLYGQVTGGRQMIVGEVKYPGQGLRPDVCSDPDFPYLTEVTIYPTQAGRWGFEWCYQRAVWIYWCQETPRFITFVQFFLPGAITKLKAETSKNWSGRVRVDWDPPAVTGGDPDLTYQYRLGRGAWQSTSEPGPIMVSAKPGRRVTISVRAVNSMGAGQASSVSVVPR